MGGCGGFWMGVWLYSSFCVFGYFSEFVHNINLFRVFVRFFCCVMLL